MENLSVSNLAVCSWSLQPANPQELLSQMAALGMRRIQLALDPLRTDPEVWGVLPALCRQNGIELISGMFGTVGEDYTTPETIRRTGGVTPDGTWEENWRNILATVEIAQKLNLKLVTFHAGFLPHDENDPQYAKLLQRIGQIADIFAKKNMLLAFETGQETAEALESFLQQLNRRNVGVNFDPANMILYEMGDPIQSLLRLGPWVLQVHIKDAVRTKRTGDWGTEVVAGQGEVDWKAFFQALTTIGFKGNLSIEREAGTQRVADILAGRKCIETILASK